MWQYSSVRCLIYVAVLALFLLCFGSVLLCFFTVTPLETGTVLNCDCVSHLLLCFQAIQKGEIGIALNTVWHYPYSDSYADKLAAARATAFTFDYFVEPIVYGKYPTEMVNHVKDGRLPTFTPEESSMLKGSYDFIGINYYSSSYVKDVPCATENITMSTDACVSIVGPWTIWFSFTYNRTIFFN